MRICIVSGTFPPDVGGPPTYLSQLIPALADRGHDVHVVTYGEPTSLELPCSIKRVSRQTPIPVRLAAFTQAVHWGTKDADLLFVSDYGLPPALVNRARRLPMVIKIVGDFAWEFSVRHRLIPGACSIDQFQTLRGGTRVRALKAMQRAYVSAAQRVIVPSYYLRSLVEGWGVPPGNIRVVYNAVPAPEHPARSAANSAIILTVARLAPWKGIDTLIAAVGRLADRSPAPRLLVAGDGDDRDRLEALAEQVAPGQVCFLGSVEKSAVERLMGEARVLALASQYEGLSHVLLEGMAAGLPIIASNIEGNRELIADGQNGWLVAPGDIPGFAAAITDCLDSPEQAARYGSWNRGWALNHGLDRLVDQTLEVCLEALTERRPAA